MTRRYPLQTTSSGLDLKSDNLFWALELCSFSSFPAIPPFLSKATVGSGKVEASVLSWSSIS